MAEDQIPIRLYADYVEWPLWGPTGPLSEDDLPLSTNLKHRIQAWFSAYDRPREGWPLWTPPAGIALEEVDDAWVAEGKAIGVLLQGELGPGYLVSVGF